MEKAFILIRGYQRLVINADVDRVYEKFTFPVLEDPSEQLTLENKSLWDWVQELWTFYDDVDTPMAFVVNADGTTDTLNCFEITA